MTAHMLQHAAPHDPETDDGNFYLHIGFPFDRVYGDVLRPDGGLQVLEQSRVRAGKNLGKARQTPRRDPALAAKANSSTVPEQEFG